jgi:hypothetical protein
MSEEDITQDPEYIKGYERGIRAYKNEHSLETRGFHAGYHALKTPDIVESKPMPVEKEVSFQEKLDDLESRLAKLERYAQDKTLP